MMQIIKPNTKIDFMGQHRTLTAISIALVVISLFFIMFKGFNLGIDFSGGTVIQVKFTNAVQLDRVREGLRPAIDSDFVLQNFGEPNEFLIRIGTEEGVSLQTLSEHIQARLAAVFADEQPEIMRIEQVGPQVGEELRRKAFLAMLYAMAGILIYVAFRFEFIFGIGAILALIHDVVLTMGIYSMIGKEFNLTVMAAVLTVAGYSLNDKIVIFDRIREKVRAGKLEEMSWKDLINMSVNETLSRTILTSFLTFLAVFSLYLFGGEVINGFALVMIVGLPIGAYSSIAVASIFVLLVRTRKGASKLAMEKSK